MLLGIDVGTTHTKAGIYARDGALLAHAKAPTPLEPSADGARCYSPGGLWQTAAGLIREGLASAKVPVEALAIASMGESGATLDAKGEPTYLIIPWYDGRAAPQMDRLTKKLGRERLYEITGLYPNPIHSVAKWLWLRENEAETWERTHLWLSAAEYISYLLTGEAVAEASLAARTMAYDVHGGHWSEELLESAGLDSSFLPPLVQAGTQIGQVSREASHMTGLAPGTPVFAGGHDHICAALACGAFTARVVLDSPGTAEGLTSGLPGLPAPLMAGGFGVGPHVVKGHSYLLGGVYSSGGALEWVRKLLGIESFEALQALAAPLEPGQAPLFLAQFHGLGPPFNDPTASGAYLGVTPEHGRAHFVRAVYEGIVFELRAGLEALEHVSSARSEVVRIVGGTDPLSPKLRAAIFKRPLELARYPDMVTLGAALLAGLGLGVYSGPEEAATLTYQAGRSYEPDAAWQSLYDDLYPHYLSVSETLRHLRAGVAL